MSFVRDQAEGGPERPGLVRLLGALLYDSMLLFAVLFAATAAALPISGGEAFHPNHPVYTAYLLAVSYVYFGWCWTRTGRTLGMRAWHIRLQGPDGGRVTWTQALGRFVFALLSWALLGAGFLWVAFDRDRLSLHDRLSGTSLTVDRTVDTG